jgi:predicted O-methyltransferase YrrM
MLKDKLYEKFGPAKINFMSCVYCDDGENVLRYFLAKHAPINHAIEIGTYQGVSTSIMAEYCKHVHTIDVIKRELTQEIFDYLGLKNISQYIVKSTLNDRNEEIELVKNIFINNNVDFVFIYG